MAVAIEPIAGAVARIQAAGSEVTGVRRIAPQVILAETAGGRGSIWNEGTAEQGR